MLEPSVDADFLFDISNEIKGFYETAVIFITQKDYSDQIFNVLCSVREALHEEDKNRLIDIIVDYHLQWLCAVNEISEFRKRLDEKFPREAVLQAITFTVDAIASRLRYYQKYMEKYRSSLPNDMQTYLLADLEIVEEMHKDVTAELLEKSKKFKNFVSYEEYKVSVNEAIDELLHWLDKNLDGLSIKLSKYININVPFLKSDLAKTLQQIVDELNTKRTPSVQNMLDELKSKGKEIGTLIRCTAGHSLELSKVFEKIQVLDDRLNRLASEPSSAAVMALKHKKEYLEKRVASLERLKITLKSVQNLTEFKIHDHHDDDEICSCEDFYQLRVFNHELPAEERERLVTELCFLWDKAVFGERSHKSIISILSAADVKEEFTDEIGTFFIDEYSRKIYRIPEDNILYQPNERGELVPVSDDIDHVYFYDECGRYFVDPNTRQRIYKAHATASEYMMDSTGVLLKVKEVREGKEYYYDNCGRYYINNEGKHIYRDEDRLSEYENDGLGNLVRIRSETDIFQPCPDDAHVTEDCKYLKQAVGPALRVCIADVLLHQPPDPIKYLSSSLVKFRQNMEIREVRMAEKEALNVEREIIAAEERAAAERAAMEAALLTQAGSEASYDSNLVMYTTMSPEDHA